MSGDNQYSNASYFMQSLPWHGLAMFLILPYNSLMSSCSGSSRVLVLYYILVSSSKCSVKMYCLLLCRCTIKC